MIEPLHSHYHAHICISWQKICQHYITGNNTVCPEHLNIIWCQDLGNERRASKMSREEEQQHIRLNYQISLNFHILSLQSMPTAQVSSSSPFIFKTSVSSTLS